MGVMFLFGQKCECSDGETAFYKGGVSEILFEFLVDGVLIS